MLNVECSKCFMLKCHKDQQSIFNTAGMYIYYGFKIVSKIKITWMLHDELWTLKIS